MRIVFTEDDVIFHELLLWERKGKNKCFSSYFLQHEVRFCPFGKNIVWSHPEPCPPTVSEVCYI